jgi:hypothetical protein
MQKIDNFFPNIFYPFKYEPEPCNNNKGGSVIKKKKNIVSPTAPTPQPWL